MKIKQKKQLNLPQLIEWAWENPKRHEIRHFIEDDDEFGSEIYVKEHNGLISIQGEFGKNDNFTVGLYEEITEDTVIPKILEVYQDASSNSGAYIHINRTISSVIEDAEVVTLHIINDDGTHTLIWRDGKLVE